MSAIPTLSAGLTLLAGRASTTLRRWALAIAFISLAIAGGVDQAAPAPGNGPSTFVLFIGVLLAALWSGAASRPRIEGLAATMIALAGALLVASSATAPALAAGWTLAIAPLVRSLSRSAPRSSATFALAAGVVWIGVATGEGAADPKGELVARLMLAFGFAFAVGAPPWSDALASSVRGFSLPGVAAWALGPLVGFFTLGWLATRTSPSPMGASPAEALAAFYWALAMATMALAVRRTRSATLDSLPALAALGQIGHALAALAIATDPSSSAASASLAREAFVMDLAWTPIGILGLAAGVDRRRRMIAPSASSGRPLVSAAWLLALASLVGLPATAGFWSRLWLAVACLAEPTLAPLPAALLSATIIMTFVQGWLVVGAWNSLFRPGPACRARPASRTILLLVAASALLFGLWPSAWQATVDSLIPWK